MSERSRSKLFARPDELLVDEHAPRIRMPVPPPRFDEDDAFARLHSIDAGLDEDEPPSTGPLRVFVGPSDPGRSGALRVGSREELPRDGRPRLTGVSLRDSEADTRRDARPMSAAARSTGLAEDLLRTEIPFDLLGGDDLPPPRVGREATALPTIKRNGPGLQVRLRGAPAAPPPPPEEDVDVLAAGSEEDELPMPPPRFRAPAEDEAFPTLPDLPLDTPPMEPPQVLNRPAPVAPEPPRGTRPNFFDEPKSGASSPQNRAPRPAPPQNRARVWWLLGIAATLLLGFGIWRYDTTHPGAILGLGRALRPGTVVAPSAATAVAPPAPEHTVAAPAQPLGAEAPVKAADPVVPAAPVDVPAPPVAPPTPVQVDAPPPKDPAPVASERRATFTMPTGRIMIVCDRKATIYVDNVKKGLTTDQRPIELTAGNHTVRLVAGSRSKTQQVRVDSEELRLIQFKF
jgi:hypothetical protein